MSHLLRPTMHPPPAMASAISGVAFEYDVPAVPLDAVTLSFPGGDEAMLEIRSSETLMLRVGLDDIGAGSGVTQLRITTP